jgi:hypothetical protein
LFCSISHVGSAEIGAQTDDLRSAFAADLYREEGSYPGFEIQIDYENGPAAACFYTDGSGELENVIRFVPRPA